MSSGEPSSALQVCVPSASREGSQRTVIVLQRSLWIGRILLPAVLWAFGFAACARLHETRGYLCAASWGLLLILSFVAWGAALTGVLLPRETFGWGLRGSIGLALSLFVLGSLACVRLVSTTAIVIWSLAGPLAFGVVRFRRVPSLPSGVARPRRRLRQHVEGLIRQVRRGPSLSYFVGLLVLYAMAVLQYVNSVTDVQFNAYDDNMAYRSFARQFLDIGTYYDPFSFRRICTLGGQSLGQAMVLGLTDYNRLHLFDGGICVVLMLGLVTGFRSYPRAGARAAILAAGLLAMTLPYTPHNTASELSGVVFFLALFQVVDRPSVEHSSARANAILIGLLVAAACSLRQNYIAAAMGFAALHSLGMVVLVGRGRRVEFFRRAIATGAWIVIGMAPWMILSWIAARTPFYPLIRGTGVPGFGFVGKVAWAEALRWSLENLFYFFPFGSVALLFVAVAALPCTRRNWALHAFLFSSTVAFALMMYIFQSADQADSIARYYFAFVTAFALAATLRALGEAGSVRRVGGAFMAGAAAVVALGVHFVTTKETTRKLYSDRITSLQDFVRQRGPGVGYKELDNLYRRIQDVVPRGEPILMMLDHTYLMNGRRNPIFNYDQPGAVGPRGGPPVFKGADAFASYLHSLGIRFIAYNLGPSSPDYNWGMWQGRLDAEVPPSGRGLYKNQARFELDFFQVLTTLSSQCAVVFEEGEVKVLDLEKKPEKKPET
jgi:hypothetical protein